MEHRSLSPVPRLAQQAPLQTLAPLPAPRPCELYLVGAPSPSPRPTREAAALPSLDLRPPHPNPASSGLLAQLTSQEIEGQKLTGSSHRSGQTAGTGRASPE